MSIQKNLFQASVTTRQSNQKITHKIKLKSLILSAAFVVTAAQAASAYANQCSTYENNLKGPVAKWDFNAGDDPAVANGIVSWVNDHGGLKAVPNTPYQGIEFSFKGKEIELDSSSEWRYKFNAPISSTWEHLTIYQPTNFYHRAAIRIDVTPGFDPSIWKEGDNVITDDNIQAKVVKADEKYLYVMDYDQKFSRFWGSGTEIFNIDSNATAISQGARSLVNNNKLSTQWQGRYSNAGMTMETESYPPLKGYENGVSYCRPVVNTSESHRTSGTVRNGLGDAAECFHPRDNGTVVELVIERVRSSSLEAKDGSYRIWKKTESTDWVMIFERTDLTAYQPDNYFTDGYVFGWSNSGYQEDTSFYLLGWEMWSEKPDFLY
ncbi:hypothetical protein OPS25_01925 [Alteromonas ponticola]|uniref:Uncharacterized protein n=1 Tax=Alteromonas aquimaris TaxID=2998417 RepID=A0ABT3P3B8_9ALTE|nr:hypothetical protein [Alteromonas aquimaris]MCW8107262.1 hypothetical protein [Alteromonas aquimaris]